MHWLALHLPLLSLEAFCATLPAAALQRPLVLVAAHRVQCVNAAAAACGIRPGAKRGTALVLAADALIAEFDAARDAAALRAVAHTALAFTPAVALHGAQTVLLEVHASLRLFGGPAALQQQLNAALAPLGHHVQAAAAPTALGAALLARWQAASGGTGQVAKASKAMNASKASKEARAGDGIQAGLLQGPHTTDLRALQALLGRVPVWLLGPGQEHWEALQGMGLHTLSDLRLLPRSGLARRFGQGLLDDLDRAFGLQPDVHDWVALPSEFDSRLELFMRADTTEQVLQGAAVLLARLVAWARARQARVGAFTLRMLHERKRHAAVPATELHVALAQPALDAAHLQLLLRERLARTALAAPTLELQLHCRHLVAAPAPNGELFPTPGGHAEGLARLLERLRARLGDEQVQRLAPVADHRPERASRVVPASGIAGAQATKPSTAPAHAHAHPRAPAAPVSSPAAAAPAPAAAPAFGSLPLHRPAWLLPEPIPLAERGTLPLLQGRQLQLVNGPERIETGWWDGGLAARDYFIALDGDGSLVWVFRSRLPGQADETMWFLHGRFG